VSLRILAIDTALDACSVCIASDATDDLLAHESMILGRGHAEALLPMIERVVSRVTGGFEALDRVAVTVGPGSYTGLRVGLSAARAIGLATGIPVVGVTTLSALLAPLLALNGEGLIAAAIDARHGAVYLQAMSMTGRCSLRRCAIFRRSTECTQSKCSATTRVLLDCRGPIMCHSIRFRRSASAAILSTPSCT
jgi:tRNA threonylcarbamoyl adenosine modification protein YeaZ